MKKKILSLLLTVTMLLGVVPVATVTAVDYITIKGEQYSTDLTSLNLYYRSLTNEDIEPLALMTNLEHLYLNNNEISDLSPLSGLTKLEYLQLGWNQITDISPLSGLTNLDELSLFGNQISDVAPLSGLTNLTWLSLYSNQISDLSPLSGLTDNLTWLTLFGNPISNVEPLSGLTNLEYLTLSDTYNITDITSLSGLTKLRSLNVSDNKISDLTPLSGLTNLEYLYLNYNPITIEQVNALKEALPNCYILHNAPASVDYITIKGVRYSTNLAMFDEVYNQNLTDNDIKPLVHMTNLHLLDLTRNKISDITPISGLTNLEELYLGDNQIKNITPLSRLMNLTVLNLRNNQIEDIAPLSELADLEYLILYGNQISDITPISELTNLVDYLDLSNNLIRDITPLSGLTNLEVLDLRDNLITLEQVDELKEALPNCQILHNAVPPAKADVEIIDEDIVIDGLDIFENSIVIEAGEPGLLTIPESELGGIKTDNMRVFAIFVNKVIEAGKVVENQDGSLTVDLLPVKRGENDTIIYFLQRIQPGSVKNKGKVTGNRNDITISDALHALMAVAKMPSSDAYGDADARCVRAAKVNNPDANEIVIADALHVLMFVARMPSNRVVLLAK